MKELTDERKLVQNLKALFEKSRASILKKIYINVNLATKGFVRFGQNGGKAKFPQD